MSLQDNKTVVFRFNKEFIEGGNLDVFTSTMAPGFVNHTAPAGVSAGADGVLYFINDVFKKAFSNLTVEIYQQVAEGDTVVTHKAFHAVHSGPFMGIAPTGKNITMLIMDIVKLHKGQYTHHWGIRDMAHLMAQIDQSK